MRLPHADDVEQIAFSPNGRSLATTTDDNLIQLWEKQQTWRQIRDISRFNFKQLQFSEDSRHVMIRSQEAGLERLAVNETSTPIQSMASTAVDPILTDRYVITGSCTWSWHCIDEDAVQ